MGNTAMYQINEYTAINQVCTVRTKPVHRLFYNSANETAFLTLNLTFI